MQAQQELEYLALIVQDFIATQPRSSQIALAERAQHCVTTLTQALQPAAPVVPSDEASELPDAP